MNEPVTIPEEAVEAAAEAHYRWVFGDAVWSEENNSTKDDFRHEARAALEAATPAILAAERERIAEVLALCDEAERMAAVAVRGTDTEGVGFNACVSSFDVREALGGES